MPRYNFTSLSFQDFEELVRDLLQAEWGVALEAFRAGRDQGIDLRHASADGGATVIQCKHYAGSSFSKLLGELRDRERPKIVLLRPRRYVVVTSVRLTPHNKDELVESLAPFLLGVADVIGGDDLEGLLSRHPAIERANFKLWLTSVGVLERVLHNAEQCQTDFEVERIRRKLPLFVQNDAFARGMQLLDDTRILVVSGVPGIGKTTLAEMILFTYLEKGFEPVVITSEISEGRKFFRPTEKKIFYFDDFLGQTFLRDRSEYLGRNQDAALVDFFEMIRRSQHARFILTTREHILQGALLVSERLSHSAIREHRCVLELDDYSHGHKARILYNHLYFSDLPEAYKEALLQDDFFLEIIKHEHFSPRIVEWLSAYIRVRDVEPRSYRSFVSQLLGSPQNIWSHAFQNQISDAARNMLLALYTLGQWIEVPELELAFSSLNQARSKKYNRPIASSDGRNALRELDGAFLSFGYAHASFINPSVREFVAAVILDDADTPEDLLRAVVRFKQIAHLWKLAEARPASKLSAFIRANPTLLISALDKLLLSPETRWEKMPDGSSRGYYNDFGWEAKLSFLVKLAEALQMTEVVDLIARVASELAATWEHQVPEYSAVLDLLELLGRSVWLLPRGGRDVYDKLQDGLLGTLLFARASEWLELLEFPGKALQWTAEDDARLSAAFTRYKDRGVFDDRSECTTIDEMAELKDSLEKLGEKFGLDFKYEVGQLEERIAEKEEAPKRDYKERGVSPTAITPFREDMSDDEIRQMFRTLRD